MAFRNNFRNLDSSSNSDEIFDTLQNSLIERDRIVERSPKSRFSRFNDIISSSAYKTIYRAFDNEEGKEVAWNVLSPSGMSSSQISKLDSEIHLLMKIQHKNLLKCISSWTNASGQLIIIAELIQGTSIKNTLKKIDKPRLKLIKYWCKEILLGINYLHCQSPSIVHRNIRPENIYLISNTGEIRIGEFGFSTTLSNLSACTVVGTPEYMAPEIYEGDCDTSVDIYAYGMCVLEMCTGEMPYFECPTPAAVYRKVISRNMPSALERICDEEARSFIELCLGDISRRPTSRELLSNSFLRCEEKDSRVHHTLLLKQPCERYKNNLTVLRNGTRLVEISLIISEPGHRNTFKPNEVKFYYNLNLDKPESVAQEMISQLNLNSASSIIIAKEIEAKVFLILTNKFTVSSHTMSDKDIKRNLPMKQIPDIDSIQAVQNLSISSLPGRSIQLNSISRPSTAQTSNTYSSHVQFCYPTSIVDNQNTRLNSAKHTDLKSFNSEPNLIL